MKKHIVISIISFLFTACSEDVEVSMSQPQQNEIEEIKEFIIPDTIDVKKEWVIAAYYEKHPKEACVIFAYSDSTKSAVKRYSYSSDSSFDVKELESVYYNQYKIKDEPSENFIIKPTTVVWLHQNGNAGASAEFDRIDITK